MFGEAGALICFGVGDLLLSDPGDSLDLLRPRASTTVAIISRRSPCSPIREARDPGVQADTWTAASAGLAWAIALLRTSRFCRAHARCFAYRYRHDPPSRSSPVSRPSPIPPYARSDACSPRGVLQAEPPQHHQPPRHRAGLHRRHLLPGLEGGPAGEMDKLKNAICLFLLNTKTMTTPFFRGKA